MRPAARLSIARCVVLASVLATQALASCSVWMTVGGHADCCPLPMAAHGDASGWSSDCCAGRDADAEATAPATVLPPAGAHPAFPSAGDDVDPRVGYRAGLPVAARGHTFPVLSAFLI